MTSGRFECLESTPLERTSSCHQPKLNGASGRESDYLHYVEQALPWGHLGQERHIQTLRPAVRERSGLLQAIKKYRSGEEVSKVFFLRVRHSHHSFRKFRTILSGSILYCIVQDKFVSTHQYCQCLLRRIHILIRQEKSPLVLCRRISKGRFQ
jgi:hypothetical protein